MSQPTPTPTQTITGRYSIDLEHSAKLHAGYFTDRFIMKPGYEQSLQDYVDARRNLVAGIVIGISAEHLTIASPDGSDTFPVIALTANHTPAQLIVDWDGRLTFKVISLAPGIIRLENPGNELDQWALRQIAPT